MSRMRRALWILVAFPLIAAAVKKEAPVDLTLSDLDGKRVHLRDYRGKVVVLNFWATWCAPCRDEMPLLTAAEKQWREKGVVFVAVSLDEKDSRKSIPEFVKRFQIGFPVLAGATGDDLARLGLGEAVPDTAFLDERGVIVFRVLGQMREGELEERLRWITGDRAQQSLQPTPQLRTVHLGK